MANQPCYTYFHENMHSMNFIPDYPNAWDSIKEAMIEFEDFAATVDRIGNREYCIGYLHLGLYEENGDSLPDYELTVGPRGGIRKRRI